MAVRIVNVFKMVRVNHKQTERVIITARTLNFVLSQFFKLAAVVTFCQRILRRLVKQLHFFFLAVGNVLESHIQRDFIFEIDHAGRQQQPERFAFARFNQKFKIIDNRVFFKLCQQLRSFGRFGKIIDRFKIARVFDVQPEQSPRFVINQHQLVVLQPGNNNRKRRHLNHQTQTLFAFFGDLFQRVKLMRHHIVRNQYPAAHNGDIQKRFKRRRQQTLPP